MRRLLTPVGLLPLIGAGVTATLPNCCRIGAYSTQRRIEKTGFLCESTDRVKHFSNGVNLIFRLEILGRNGQVEAISRRTVLIS